MFFFNEVDVKNVRLSKGIAQDDISIDGRINHYVGAFNLYVDAGNIDYEIELLVPGTLNSLIYENWNNYENLLSIVKVDRGDSEYNNQRITLEEGRYLRQILQQLQNGDIKVKSAYNYQAMRDYISEVASFLEPRIELGVKYYAEGQTYARQQVIEERLRELKESEHREEPGLSVA